MALRTNYTKISEVEILYLLIPLSLVLVAIAAAIFLLMSNADQFEDLDGPALQILMDDDRPVSSIGTSERII